MLFWKVLETLEGAASLTELGHWERAFDSILLSDLWLIEIWTASAIHTHCHEAGCSRGRTARQTEAANQDESFRF